MGSWVGFADSKDVLRGLSWGEDNQGYDVALYRIAVFVSILRSMFNLFLLLLSTLGPNLLHHHTNNLSIYLSFSIIVITSFTRPTMADAETLAIIQPLFYKAEQCLDLQPLLGKLFSKGILDYYLMQKLESMNVSRTNQNRAFLMYLLTQPVQQLKSFCTVLREQAGNAAHRELAVAMLDAFPPDPMEADITPVQGGPHQVCQPSGW